MPSARQALELRRATRLVDTLTEAVGDYAGLARDEAAPMHRRVDATSMTRAALESLAPALLRLVKARAKAACPKPCAPSRTAWRPGTMTNTALALRPITDPADIKVELMRRLTTRPARCDADWLYLPQLPRVHCADGFNVSIQASSTHYCSPREDRGPWYMVELGYPSAPMPTLVQWAKVLGGDDATAETMTDGVWGYVPVAAVVAVLAAHGGLVAVPV